MATFEGRFKIAGNTAAGWTSDDTVLLVREIGYETDTGKFKVGDGSTAWSSLTYHNQFTDALLSKLTGIESSAKDDQTGAEIKTLYEAEADTNAFTDAEQTKLSGIETAADVTDTTNVTAAGALMDSEVDADIKTLSLPASTTISTFGASLIDDADAAAARATLGLSVEIGIAVSDETTALTTGTAKATFRMPYAMTVTDVRASVSTAPTGSTIIVDINDGGTTIFSTRPTIDASEKTTETAATPSVLSDTALADDAEITIDIDQVGSTVAGAGLKVWIIGTRT